MLLLFFHPKTGLFFSSSSTILLAAARPAQGRGREGGGGQQEASGTDSITTRLSLSERASPPPSPRLTAAEKGLSQRPLFATARTDRPPTASAASSSLSLARARSWSRYWGEEEGLCWLVWVGGEGESVALAFHSPAPPLVFLTFPRWRAHYRVRERPSFRLYTPSPFCPLFSVSRSLEMIAAGEGGGAEFQVGFFPLFTQF